MKYKFLKNIAALLFASAIAIACNNKTAQDGIGPDIENPPSSQDSLQPGYQAGGSSDSATLKNADASRMSGGKDSVKGEVTPPNAKEQ